MMIADAEFEVVRLRLLGEVALGFIRRCADVLEGDLKLEAKLILRDYHVWPSDADI